MEINQAKRIKRKRKETFGKYKINNKGIGVRTSISRLSSRVDLDDLFSDSDDEEDSMDVMLLLVVGLDWFVR